ncbi:hypothetical protein BDZ89DRAFT_1052437 [Hymenopellis radicata]|nr:hypothetical protein BDZ89DRAFT_1052437 [Hymenopellis radicata]
MLMAALIHDSPMFKISSTILRRPTRRHRAYILTVNMNINTGSLPSSARFDKRASRAAAAIDYGFVVVVGGQVVHGYTGYRVVSGTEQTLCIVPGETGKDLERVAGATLVGATAVD